MKKLILLLTFCLGGFAQAQSTNLQTQFWTNGFTIYTNITLGSINVPLTSNQWFACAWVADQWNKSMDLTGTNRFKAKDVFAFAAWNTAQTIWIKDWQEWLQQTADAKAAVRRIKEALNSNEATDAQLQQILTILGL